MSNQTQVTMLRISNKFVVLRTAYDFMGFDSFDEADKFCRDMGYKVVPLNSKRGIRIKNPTDPRGI